ncbi:MAG TPA: S8 family serine peptidase [Ktedonobacteraceae bacterium]
MSTMSTDSATSGMSTDYPTYPAPNSNAWAYNSGTSFATPIISALAARILEQEPESSDLHQAIISASRGQQTVWTSVADSNMGTDVKDESGPMILAMQDWCPEGTSIP